MASNLVFDPSQFESLIGKFGIKKAWINILATHIFAETTAITKRVCPGRDSNPHVRCHTQDFKSCASAISPPGHLGETKLNIFMKFTIIEKRYFF